MKFLIAIIVFSFLIIFHELGHFLLAKYNGISVLEFSLGMGPRLLSFQGKETRYSLKLLPFGGSCMMLGEEGENEETDMKGSFQNASVGARISVILAGPFFNFIAAIIAAFVLVSVCGVDTSSVDTLTPGGAAAKAGLKEGDVIVSLNDYNTYLFGDIQLFNMLHQGENVTVKYKRDGEIHVTDITPKYDESVDYYFLGLGSDTSLVKGGFFDRVKYSLYEIRFQFNQVLESLKMLVTGKVKLKDLTGVVGIVSVIGATYETGLRVNLLYAISNVLELVILLNFNLGVMNLIPFPALDGGRTLMLIIEKLRGKRIDPNIEEKINMIGLMLLLVLMAVVMINDFRYHIF